MLGYFSAWAQDSTVVIEGELKQWHAISITFEGPTSSEEGNPNPFFDYRLNVTFSHQDSSFLVPGYFAADGNAAESSAKSGNKWRVHFAPHRVGLWTWQVSFRQGNKVAINSDPSAGNPTSFDGKRGTFVVGASDKSGADFRAKGRLTYVGEHYLKFAGTDEYYIKGGSNSPENFLAYYEFDDTQDYGGNPNGLDTDGAFESQGVIYNYNNDGLHHYDPHLLDWQEGNPTWQGGKGKRIIGAINYLGSEAVNVLYMLTNNVDGDGREVYPWISYDSRNRYDVSKLAQWNIVFDYMQLKGIVLHFILQETENDDLLDGGDLGNDRKLYYRELIARFAHHNAIIWNLGEENTNTYQQRDDFSQYIHATDPYGHFQTVQTNIGQQNDVYTPFLGKEYFDGASIQEDYWEVHDETQTWVDRSRQSGRDWIVFCDETGPFQTGVSPDGPANNHHVIREEVLYGNLFAGGAGNEWYFGYDLPHNDLDCEDFRSRDRMWDYTRYSVEFWKRFMPINRMRGADELLSGNAYAFANPGEIYAVYLPHGEEVQLNLDSLETAFRLSWFNPREGGFLQSGTVDSVQGPGWVSLGLPPDGVNGQDEDWIVVVGVANMPPIFEISADLKLNENFSTTERVSVIPATVPEEELDQVVIYSLSPASVSFANISFDSLTGEVSVTAVPDQSGRQVFTIRADDGQSVNNIYEQTFLLSISPPQPPIAVMSVNPLTGAAPLSVSFDGSLSDDANGPIVQYLWNSGDGTIADTVQFTHIYTQAGSYQATLTVVDTDGMVSVVDTTIEVRDISSAVLFVVGDQNLNNGDQTVVDSLAAWGYEVVIKDDASALTTDAIDKQMVFISSTVTSGIVGNKFVNADVPVMLWEPYLYDDMMMTGPLAQTHYGQIANQQRLQIDNAANALIAVVAGDTLLSNTAATMAWGKPSDQAIPIARFLEDSSQLGIFVYETGALMEGLAAPAIRIGMFWQNATPAYTSPAAWEIARQLVCWATNCQADTARLDGMQLARIEDQFSEVGDSVALQISMIDPVDSVYRFTAMGLPLGLNMDTLGMIGGIITAEVGVYPVMIRVADADSLTTDAQLQFNWIVFTPNPNLPPELFFIEDQLHEQGMMISLEVEGMDLDGDNIYYTVIGQPNGLTIDSLTGEIYGIIDDSIGIYEVRVDVWDDGEPAENAYRTFLWEVIPPIPNQAPILRVLANQVFEEGSELSIQLSATDPDEGDSLSYAISGLPAALMLDPMTGLISGQLTDEIGTYLVEVIVFDNGDPVESDSMSFELRITEKVLEALLVVGQIPLNSGDAAISLGLRYLGYEVEALKDTEAQTSSVTDKELIFISSTVSSWAITTKFSEVAVPLICSEVYLYDDLQMVAGSGNLGNIGGQNGLSIVDPTHEVASDLSGEINVLYSNQEVGWGTPTANASLVASLQTEPAKAMIFTYEQGVQMNNLIAPARRVGFFLRNETATELTDEGWLLFDATVCWAAGCKLGSARKGRNIAVNPIALKVYPNPVRDILTVEYEQISDASTRIEIVDLMGKSLLDRELPKGQNQHQISITHLPAGIYLLRLRQNGRIWSEKIVKQ